MKPYSFILLFAVIGIINFLGGCAPSTTRTGANTLRAIDNRQTSSTKTEEQPDPFLAEAFEKPYLGERIDRKYGAPPPLPDVPDMMEHLQPLRASAQIVNHIGDRTYYSSLVFNRSEKSAQVEYKDRKQEWLFRRNPVDNRRVSAFLIDHHERVILDYPQSDLLDAKIANGWTEVMTLGLPLDLFNNMHATGKTKTLNGIVFMQYLKTNSAKLNTGAPSEIWWSEKYFLPLKIVRNSEKGQWTQVLTQVRFEVDRDALKPPIERFPNYACLDNADWSDCDHHHTAIRVMGLSR